MSPTEITCPGTIDHLADLLGFLDRAVEAAGLDPDVAFAFHLAAEEACTNVMTHGYAASDGPVSLRLDVAPGAATVTITDRAPLFDPASAPPPPLDGPAEDRPVGGLGWHLIRETMDEVRHEAVPGGGNRLTLVKHLPSDP